MKRTAIPLSHDLKGSAERQMRTWAIALEERAKSLEKSDPAKEHAVRPYIAISREAGIDALEIARLIAANLKWKIMDKNLLDRLAEERHCSRIALEFVDERTPSWFKETIGKWIDPGAVSQLDYVRSMARVVLLAAHNESMIFVGRGAQFLLPRERGLTVRLVAPVEQRLKCIVAELGCAATRASEIIAELDRGRAHFVQRYFHRRIDDPLLYDLVLNLEHFSPEAASETIYQSVKHRFVKPTSAA